MRIGDVIMTTSIQVRTEVLKPRLRASFKSSPNTAMVFIACGSVTADGDENAQARRVLESLGWTQEPFTVGWDIGIAQAFGAQS